METLKRILVALIFLPVFFFFVFNTWFNGILLLTLLLSISILGAIELYKIYKAKDIKVNISLIIFFIFASWIGEFLTHYYPLLIENFRLWTIIILFIILSTIELFKKDFKHSLEKVSAGLLIFIYLGILLPFAYKIKMISPNGAYIVTFIAIITWSCDTFAYFAGKFFGKHKLNLPVSPNKTLEGFAGGIVCTIGIAFLTRYLFMDKLNISLFKLKYFIPVTILIIFFAIIGDMIESVFKRSGHVKDSEKVIPGHGGILDAFDSIIITSTVFYFIMLFTA